jgi:N-acetylmuramoyl-L-alanine amidase
MHGADTRIRVVYPKPEQQIFEDSTFLMGSIVSLPPGGYLAINDEPVPVSAHGFFAWKIPVHAGMNPVRLTVRETASLPPVAQELFALYGVPPLSVLPETPLAIHEETILPSGDVWLSDGDTLTVACSASVNAEVFLDIPGLLAQPLPLTPLHSDARYLDTREMIFAEPHWTQQRIPTQGYYQLQVPVSALLQQRPPMEQPPSSDETFPMSLHLRHGTHHLEKTLPARLTLLKRTRPAVIAVDRSVTRTAPQQGARLTSQRADTWVKIDGLLQGWARARLSRDEAFFVALDDLTFLSTDVNQQPLLLSSIKTSRLNANQSLVTMAFTGRPTYACPVQVEVFPSDTATNMRLQVRLYGVCSQCDFIQYPPQDEDALIRQIHWRQVAENVLEVWLDLQKPLAGYDYFWRDGQWQFTIKTLPMALSEIHVLIDPGHGGAESGSTGLNGLPEKDLNLTVSRLLRDALLAEGFRVSLTRDRDEDLSLQARGQSVIEHQADIVLSIHHNALPDGRDPLKAEGASTFYYQLFSKPLAEVLLAGLTDNRGSQFNVPNYGLFYDSLYMTRIHQALAVLVEIGFFTYPQEFERLIDPAFQREAANRLASALRDYCLGYFNQAQRQ